MDPLPSEMNYGAIYGPLSFPLIILSQYLKSSQTVLSVEFTGFSASAFVTSIVLKGVYGFSGTTIVASCFVNKFTPVFVSSAVFDSIASSLTFVFTASQFGTDAVVRCSASGLTTPAAAAVARNDVSVSTLDSSGRKVDTLLTIEFPPIFNNVATPIPGILPLKLSSNIRSTSLSTLMLSFTSSGAGSIKTITIQGLSDFAISQVAFSSVQNCSHGNIEYPAVASYSSPFLSITVNASGFAASSSDVVCTVRGLILPSSAVAAKNDLVITTFDINRAALDTVASVSLPPVFASVAMSVFVSLSSVISNTTKVVLTVSFISPNPLTNTEPKNPIKVISLTGVFFDSFAATEPVKCFHQSGLATGDASFTSSAINPIAVIKLSGTDSIASSAFSVSCLVSGFRNVATQRVTTQSVGLSTWDASYVPVDTASNAVFPNIFAFTASNATVTLSSQIIAKSRVTMTFKFKVPFTNQPITSITLSGLPLSPPMQQHTTSADCYVDNPSSTITSDSVSVVVTGAAAELSMSFASGLPVGTGPVGIGTLSVICKILNLVNSPLAAGVRPVVSVSVFGANSAPLYFQIAIRFPAIFEQSLGFNRPRVSVKLFFAVVFLMLFIADYVVQIHGVRY